MSDDREYTLHTTVLKGTEVEIGLAMIDEIEAAKFALALLAPSFAVLGITAVHLFTDTETIRRNKQTNEREVKVRFYVQVATED